MRLLLTRYVRPLTNDIYGGSFLYHAADNLVCLMYFEMCYSADVTLIQIYVGLVIGLDYTNTYINPVRVLCVRVVCNLIL